MEKGLDLSKWNGEVDFSEVAKSHDFVILRASYGWRGGSFINGGHDECFERNYREAKKFGLKVGAYHYSYARNCSEARLELSHFLGRIKGKTFEYPLIYDVEDEKVQGKISKKELTDIAISFLEGLEKDGYYAMLYSSKYWLETKFDIERLKRFDCWLAQWSSLPTYKGNYGIWQYSSTGSVLGVKGPVDQNYSYKDYEKIMKTNGLNGFKKESAPNPSQGEPAPKLVAYSNDGDLFAAALYAKEKGLPLAYMQEEPKAPYVHIGYNKNFKKMIFGENKLNTLEKVIEEIKRK